jgi:hypothetical protein
MSRESMKQPKALVLADALDDESTQGRISNYNGRKAAVELRRLHEVNRDLLEALESITKSNYIKHHHPKRYAKAVAAIAKATGEKS